MLLRTVLLAGAALVAFALPALAAETEVGSVFEKEFYGAQGARGADVKDLYFKDTVYEREKVTTGPTGRTALQFLDATRIQVGPNSTVVLDKYVYDPNQQVGEVGVNFGKGIFRFVTGGLKNKEGYDLKTPTATMVVRGTKVIIAVDANGKSEFTFVEGTGEIIPCGGASRDALTGQTLITTPKCDGVSLGQRTVFSDAVESDTVNEANAGNIQGTPLAGSNNAGNGDSGGGGDSGGSGDGGGSGRGGTGGHQGGGFGNK
jgi:hypothetical protein